MASASLGGMQFMHAQGGLPFPIFAYRSPYWFDEGGDMDPDAFGLMRARGGQAIDQLGKTGSRPSSPSRFRARAGSSSRRTATGLKCAVCEEREILFVADEVICGFGRLGTWFGSQRLGLRPDMIAMAKGLTSGYLPMGGVGLTNEVYEGVSQDEFAHGYTYAGHPVNAAAAIANLEIMEREGLVDRVGSHTQHVFAKSLLRWAITRWWGRP